jgi:serine/threonine protein kinase
VKPANVLVDHKLGLHIADFEFAAIVRYRGIGFFTQSCARQHEAPELLCGDPFGEKVAACSSGSAGILRPLADFRVTASHCR